ncbi:glycosyltransferase WbsX family protein [Enterococcus sp. AZ072]|uniref:glycosyltransferase WbsX family protein n=1 Tax=unclassified Enterococcus TaxID=2608891 RepID=UPI003D287D75
MKRSVKILAFYLPQYHRFPENDEWWGEGFTEWKNVKKAIPLFRKHRQPRIPKSEDYYDLLDPKVITKQMNIAKANEIDGFCYYHYWFDGKLLLERPLELMLQMKTKIDYCFCWANEPWTRAWDGNTSDVLMPQKYGEEKAWEEHFQYLLPFFEDKHYIKKDGKPLFVIYRTNNIPNCNEMILYWNKRCKEQGFDGISIVEELNSFQTEPICKNSEALLEFEPMYTLKYGRSKLRRVQDKLRTMIHNKIYNNRLLVYNYDIVWRNIVKRYSNLKFGKTLYLGAFVDWDNTPRKGEKGLVIDGASPLKFKKYIKMQLDKAKEINSEYIFINAWNEWGEGTYLEEDEDNGDQYLKAVKALSKE